jgi:RNA polymerase sigma-70 factor (ECF subfamily)
VEKYKRPVFGFVYRMVGRQEEAEDLAQETFVKAYENLWRYDPAYKFSTWLFQIARNRCIDSLRRKQPLPLAAEDLERRAGQTDSPETAYLAAESGQELAAAIARLPLTQRTCLVLYHFNGLSYDEVAKTLNVPLQTVKNNLHRAREKLRTMLAEEGGSEGCLATAKSR